MVATPFDFAFASIAAPLPESIGSMSSTLAPFVIAASAWVCIVWALPWAFCTWKSSDDRPAACERLVQERLVVLHVAGRRLRVGQEHDDLALALRRDALELGHGGEVVRERRHPDRAAVALGAGTGRDEGARPQSENDCGDQRGTTPVE